MHEMSLVESVLEMIQDMAEAQSFEQVKVVTLEIGQLAAVEPEALLFCFDVLSQNTLAQGAKLEIVDVAGLGYCAKCDQQSVMTENVTVCPVCQQMPLRIIAGDSMRVKDLLVV